MKEKLLIVDGSNLLFQMFYGMPSRIFNKKGKAIHGTLGFVGALLKMIRKIQPTYVAVIFDGECENERKIVDAAYKANRPDYSQMPEEETPFSQLPDIYAALDWLKISHTETTICETDDVIAAYALQYGKEKEVVISSFDSDFFQLINDNVSVLRYRGDNSILCDAQYIREKLGIEPYQYADFKALTGDTADNIKGIDKIGPKTASKLIQTFGSLEGIVTNLQAVERTCVREGLERSLERLWKNYSLIRLSGCAELPFALENLRYKDLGVSTTQVLTAIGVR